MSQILPVQCLNKSETMWLYIGSFTWVHLGFTWPVTCAFVPAFLQVKTQCTAHILRQEYPPMYQAQNSNVF